MIWFLLGRLTAKPDIGAESNPIVKNQIGVRPTFHIPHVREANVDPQFIGDDMKTTGFIPLLSRLSTLTIALLVAALVLAGGKKIKPDELVAKHLASIGTAEARAAARNREVLGDADVIFRLGASGQLSGKGDFLSEGPMIRIGLIFNALQYPGELSAFDGKKVRVGEVHPPAVRSPLSIFINTFNALLKEGLLGGTLSTAWPLLDLAHRQPSLQYTGLKNIEGKQLHELKYEMKKGGSGLLVALYFDPETFRHVRSQYSLSTLVLRGVGLDDRARLSGGGRDVRSLVETFDNFEKVDGLTLPHAYTIIYQETGYLAEWNIAVTQILHNQKLDRKLFVVQ